MAEESPAVQNKGMLIVALVLGALVVAIYNWQIDRVRTESKGATVWLIKAERDIKAGEKVDTNKDFTLQEVSAQFKGTLGEVVVLNSREDAKYYNAALLKRPVLAGHYLTTDDTEVERTVNPSNSIDPNRVAVGVPVRDIPGEMLRPGDKVNLLGRFNLKDGVKTYRIIEGVTVRSIGGRGVRESFSVGKGYNTGDEGQINYRNITIEVTEPVSLQLETVLAHVPAGVKIEMLNPNATLPARAGEINKELWDQVANAPPPTRNGP